MNINRLNNLLELFYTQYQLSNKNEIFLTSLKQKKFFSWEETFQSVIKLSSKISSIIQKGDRCLLISENRPEWMISDLSIMLSKGITVPSYTTYTERDYEYIINDCQPSLILVSNNELFRKIKNHIKNNDFIKKIISFDQIEDKENIIENINSIFEERNTTETNFLSLDIKRKDTSCIIYTSGTQGDPKGVMLSHGGILNNCEGAYTLLKEFVSNKPHFLTWLPLSHSYEHTVQFVQMAVGAKVYYAESIDKLIKNMSDCNPEIMTAVPRFYQNLYQKINSTFNKAKGFKKKIINTTINLGKKKLERKNLNFVEKIQNFFCELLVRKKIKKQFGGSLKAFISGGGALDKEVGLFLNSIGLPTLQGYGLTETSPVVSCNPIHDIRIETVGPPFPGNEVKIAEDGEILVKGENVMQGYWKKEKETKEILKDGWLYTGDIGVIKDGFLKITDRKKDILISPGGDNISPIKIENDLTKIDFIEQALVYGDSKPYLVALIVLNKEQQNQINNELIQKEIETVNKNLSKVEMIKKFLVIKDQFTIENEMMTPTLKLKRFKIIKKYKEQLEKLMAHFV
jgi:long-chain acyl-CoA synthetase